MCQSRWGIWVKYVCFAKTLDLAERHTGRSLRPGRPGDGKTLKNTHFAERHTGRSLRPGRPGDGKTLKNTHFRGTTHRSFPTAGETW